MTGQDILVFFVNSVFEIPYKISYPYTEILDLMQTWNFKTSLN